jgi:hypothetical protein
LDEEQLVRFLEHLAAVNEVGCDSGRSGFDSKHELFSRTSCHSGCVVKKKSAKYEILISAEFSGALDIWTEYLCVQRHRNGSITLSSRSSEILAEACDYQDEDGNEDLPALINGKKVCCIAGDYVLGEELLPHDDDAIVTVARGGTKEAKSWLAERGWQKKKGYDQVWARIEGMLTS